MTTRLGLSPNDEYEAQLYGFCCKDVINHLKETIESEIIDKAEQARAALRQRQGTEEEKAIVDQAINKIKDVLLKGCSAPPAKLMEEMQNKYFGLPNHVLLPEDEIQRKRYSAEDLEQAKQKFQELKDSHKRAQYLKESYSQEIAASNKVIKQLKQGFEILTKATHSGLPVFNEKSMRMQHKHVQDLLGLEVKEAGARLIGQPLCAESNVQLDSAILERL